MAQVTAQLQTQQARSVSARQAVVAANARLRTTRAEEAAVQKRLTAIRASIKGFAVERVRPRCGARGREVGRGGQPERDRAPPNTCATQLCGPQSDALDTLVSARQDLAAKRKAAESAAATRRQPAARRQRCTRRRCKRHKQAQLRLVSAARSRYQASLREDQVAGRGSFRGGSSACRRFAASPSRRRSPDSSTRCSTPPTPTACTSAAPAIAVRQAKVAARRRNCGIERTTCTRSRRRGAIHRRQSRASQCTSADSPSTSPTTAASSTATATPGTNGSAATPRGYGFHNLPSEAWHWSVNGN